MAGIGPQQYSGRRTLKKIMVVEDDRQTLDLIGSVLSDAGYQPLLMLRSDGVPETMESEKPDLILLDILLEPKHGIEVLDSVANLPHPPVILMSAAVSGVREMGAIARALGAVDFLEKPFDVSELLIRVRAAMAVEGERKAA